MQIRNDLELEVFLRDYPRMSVAPSRNSSLVLKGIFDFEAHSENKLQIIDHYSLKINVPLGFPKEVPVVTETDRKIPRDGKHHVNDDKSLCLGSPLRLRWKLLQNPCLVGFAENCLVPYLYAISHKLKYGGELPFGELAHGEAGVINDYIDLFGLHSADQVKQALELLSMKKRLANKKPCPCGCGKRLGVCSFHRQVNKFRNVGPRSWFRAHVLNMGVGM